MRHLFPRQNETLHNNSETVQNYDLDELYDKEIDGIPLDQSLPPIFILFKNIAVDDPIAKKKMIDRLLPMDLQAFVIYFF